MNEALLQDSESIPAVQAQTAWRDAATVAAYGVAWGLGFFVSTYYWFLPAGLRFACLWWAPRRLWPWLALAEFAAILLVVLSVDQGYRTWVGFALGVFLPWAVHAGVIALAQRGVDHRLPDTPWRMARLLLAMVAAAFLTAIALSAMSAVEGATVAQEEKMNLIAFAIGDFIGMLIVTPIWLHLASARRQALGLRPFIELLALFLPILAVLSLVPTLRPQAVTYTAVLILAPMVVMVFRHGWEGGGWGLALTSVAVYALGEAFDTQVTRELMQLFLSIVGAVSLMLGAAVRALRAARDALTERNIALAAQAQEMRELGQRLVRAQEDEQRRLALELQSELEQGMTALGTRLGLLTRTALEPAQMAAVDSLRGLTQEIHASMRDAVLRLRPLLLDRSGLVEALRSGPIRDLLLDAGVAMGVVVQGDPAELEIDVQGAIYRICQEAATDCVRRAGGKRLEIDLRVDAAAQDSVRLQIGYDDRSGTLGRDPSLPATRDRVLALGGDYECVPGPDGLQHRIRIPRAA